MALVYQHGVKDIHQSFIDKEGLKQGYYNCSSFTQDQEGTIDPGTLALEDGEKSDLRKICE